jgi:hypothetical protein
MGTVGDPFEGQGWVCYLLAKILEDIVKEG